MMQMRVKGGSVVIALFVLQCLSTLGSSQDFDFFYLVQQWPVSYCNKINHDCCYSTTGKPDEDFIIHGLWPTYNSGKWPENCDLNNSLDILQISDLLGGLRKFWPSLACPSEDGTRLWGKNWVTYGTCSSLDQHSYFQAALDLRTKFNLLQAIESAGVRPGDIYRTERIKEAIEEGVGYEPYIECNLDVDNNSQIYQIWLCVDKSASNFIKCPIFPNQRRCPENSMFPTFSYDESKKWRVAETELPVTSY